MPRQWRRYIARANAIIERGCYLAWLQFVAGYTFYIENPADVGFMASPHFKWSKRAAVSLWITSWVRRLASLVQAVWGTTAMCGWQSRFQKLTTIMASGPEASPVSTINAIQCTHSKHEAQADGVDADGIQLSRIAWQYPPLFCSFFGHNFTHATPWHAKEAAALTPCALQLLKMLRAQRAAQTRALDHERLLGARVDTALAGEEDSVPASVPRDEDSDDELVSDEHQPTPPPASARAAQHAAGPSVEPSDATALLKHGWRSAHYAIPKAWPESADVLGPAYQAARTAPLEYVSRRRAESEEPSVLAARPMPRLTQVPTTEPRARRSEVAWPQGCPPRPILISQLYFPGVYASIQQDIATVQLQCEQGRAGDVVSRFPGSTYPPESSQPEWARQCAWDATDPADCVPLQPSVDEPPQQGARPEFFQRWGDRLAWPDKEMLSEVTTSGIEDSSHDCSQATIVNGHHGGLRRNFAAADKAVEADRKRGFVTAGRQDLWIVPSMMVPKNCVRRKQWKLEDGILSRKIKWRVSTDDSIDTHGETSRNNGMHRDEWSKPGLPSPRTLAEMVAITKSAASDMDVAATARELEQVALWAFDLTHAYR